MIGFLTRFEEQVKLQESKNKEHSKSPTRNPCELWQGVLSKGHGDLEITATKSTWKSLENHHKKLEKEGLEEEKRTNSN